MAATVDVQSHEFLPHWVVSATVDVQRRQTVRQSYASFTMSEAERIGSATNNKTNKQQFGNGVFRNVSANRQPPRARNVLS